MGYHIHLNVLNNNQDILDVFLEVFETGEERAFFFENHSDLEYFRNKFYTVRANLRAYPTYRNGAILQAAENCKIRKKNLLLKVSRKVERGKVLDIADNPYAIKVLSDPEAEAQQLISQLNSKFYEDRGAERIQIILPYGPETNPLYAEIWRRLRPHLQDIPWTPAYKENPDATGIRDAVLPDCQIQEDGQFLWTFKRREVMF